MSYYYYGYEFPPPIVDHVHQRTHQHRNLFQYLTHQNPRPEDYPNRPDCDIRDAFTHYFVDVEVPGVKNPKDITVVWTSTRSLVVSGSIEAPDTAYTTTVTVKPENVTGTRDAEGDWKERAPHEPELLIGERKMGPFRRHFTFPEEVNMEMLAARLDAGLLRIRVPKKGMTATKPEKVTVHEG
jgi:HSP20 family molecular chaperone IbpA